VDDDGRSQGEGPDQGQRHHGEATVKSTRGRALLVGATLAATQLAGMTAAAGADAVPRPPTEGQVGEAWHQRREATPAEAAAEAALRRIEARERHSIPRNAPAPAPPGEPAGRAGWLLPSLGALAVVVAVAGVLIAGPRIAGGRHETVP
jgi:hypothetical protein